MVTSPVSTIGRVVRQRSIIRALIVIIVSSVAQGVFQAVSLVYTSEAERLVDQNFALALEAVGAVVGTPAALVVIVFLSAVFWAMSRLLGGHGSYRSLFVGLAFATVPYAASAPVTFVVQRFDEPGSLLSWVIGFGVFAWTMVLWTIVVRESNEFSIARASVAVLVSLAVILFFLIALSVIVLVAVFSIGNDFGR